MSDIKLSKDADALICLIYKYYLTARDNGISKTQAKHLGSSEDVKSKIIPEWSLDDVDETCKELHKANMLSVLYASNICYDIDLNDDAIIYMENRFPDKVKGILNYISLIKFW